jgi:ABC-type dipeptide/oligopeptide/nickel transport system permease component
MRALSLWHTVPRPLRILVIRCLMIVPQMLGVTLVAFLLVRLLPGDPARLILGNFATEDSIRLMRDRLGLDQSLPVQAERYFVSVLHGDLGVSPFTSNPVIVDLPQRAHATLELVVYAMALTVVFAVSMAVLSGETKRRRRPSRPDLRARRRRHTRFLGRAAAGFLPLSHARLGARAIRPN